MSYFSGIQDPFYPGNFLNIYESGKLSFYPKLRTIRFTRVAETLKLIIQSGISINKVCERKFVLDFIYTVFSWSYSCIKYIIFSWIIYAVSKSVVYDYVIIIKCKRSRASSQLWAYSATTTAVAANLKKMWPLTESRFMSFSHEKWFFPVLQLVSIDLRDVSHVTANCMSNFILEQFLRYFKKGQNLTQYGREGDFSLLYYYLIS